MLGKSSEEILEVLFHEYTNNGATTEDALAADALSLTFEVCDIKNLEELGNIQPIFLLKEILINYIIVSFDFRYYEHICKTKTPKETNRILNEIHEYIKTLLYETIEFKNLDNVEFNNLTGSEYVTSALDNALNILENYYGEE